MKKIPLLAVLLISLYAAVAVSIVAVALEHAANPRPLSDHVPPVKAIRRQEVGPSPTADESGGLFVTVVIFKCQRCGAMMCQTGKSVLGTDGKSRFEYSCANCQAGGLAQNLYPMVLTNMVPEPSQHQVAVRGANGWKLGKLYFPVPSDSGITWQYDYLRAENKARAEKIKLAEEFNRTNTGPYTEYTAFGYIQFNPKPGDMELGYREDGVVVWRTPPEASK